MYRNTIIINANKIKASEVQWSPRVITAGSCSDGGCNVDCSCGCSCRKQRRSMAPSASTVATSLGRPRPASASVTSTLLHRCSCNQPQPQSHPITNFQTGKQRKTTERKWMRTHLVHADFAARLKEVIYVTSASCHC